MTTNRETDLAQRLRAALAHLPRVTEKKMFGGTAFMVRGKICVTARPERLLCRIDPAAHDAAVKRTGCRTMVMKGREYRGYVHVDAESVRTQRALKYWVDLALKYNEALVQGREGEPVAKAARRVRSR